MTLIHHCARPPKQVQTWPERSEKRDRRGAPVVWTSHQCIRGRRPSQLVQVQGRRESRGEAEKLSANIKIWHQILYYAFSPPYLGHC